MSEDHPRHRPSSQPTDQEITSAQAHESGHARRRVLELAGAAAVVSLAGCLGGGNGAATDEPTEPPADASCGVCKMAPVKFPDWNAQLVFGDGERVHFCSPGCFAAFYADPGHFVDGRSQDDIAGTWVTDHTSKAFTDAATASFVLETNADRIDAPMMKNPVPFADDADAQAYVEQYDDLGSDDVVGLDAFDVALAKQYRARFFE